MMFPLPGRWAPPRPLGLNFFRDVLPLVSSLVLMAGLLYLCYRFSRYLAKRASGFAAGKNMRILERAALAQDKGLVIAEICKKYYLIAFSNERVEILRELDESEFAAPAEQEFPGKNFLDVFSATLKSRMEGKPDGRDGGGSEPKGQG